MRKVIITFGLLAGGIISVLMVISLVLWEKGIFDFNNAEVFGYATMVLALSMVFFGIKSYRDNYQNGAIKFSKGLQIGLLITLIASVMYAGTWEAYCQTSPNIQAHLDKYTEHYINKMKEKGASTAEIDQKVKEMADMKELYKNPVFRFGFTLMEILPVGIILTLLSAAVLRKKEVLPALEVAES